MYVNRFTQFISLLRMTMNLESGLRRRRNVLNLCLEAQKSMKSWAALKRSQQIHDFSKPRAFKQRNI